MRLYGGIDLHSNNSVIHLIDENDKLVLKRRGNKYLSWAFIEAANFAIRFNST